MKPVTVTYNPGNLPQDRIMYETDTIQAAEEWIDKQSRRDPEGVRSGWYGIDAPEEMINPSPLF